MPKNLDAKAISDRERDICARLREVRENLKWKQPDFAKELETSSDVLKSYEYGRARLPYSLAKKLGEKFDVNQRWLYSGLRPKKPYIDVSPDMENAIPGRTPFSHVYERILKQLVEDTLAQIAKSAKCKIEDIESLGAFFDFGPVGELPDEASRKILLRVLPTQIANLVKMVPPNLHEKLFKAMHQAMDSFQKLHDREIREYFDHRAIQLKRESELKALRDQVSERLKMES